MPAASWRVLARIVRGHGPLLQTYLNVRDLQASEHHLTVALCPKSMRIIDLPPVQPNG